MKKGASQSDRNHQRTWYDITNEVRNLKDKQVQTQPTGKESHNKERMDEDRDVGEENDIVQIPNPVVEITKHYPAPCMKGMTNMAYLNQNQFPNTNQPIYLNNISPKSAIVPLNKTQPPEIHNQPPHQI